MSREKFAALLEKYQEGRCSDQEKELVEYWFALVETNVAPKAAEHDLKGMEDRIWSQMQVEALPDFREGKPVVPLRNIFLKWSGVAASLLLVTWFFLGDRFGEMFRAGTNGAESAWVEKRNDGTGTMLITLEDSSTVELAPNSVLSFPEHFEPGQRVVALKGKGFFKIQRNAQKPFFVRSGEMVTKVLGTSFYVQNEANGLKTKVEVVTGLVSVYGADGLKGKQANPILLKPNHNATFDRETEAFSVGLAEQPRLVNADIAFQFKNAPLAIVAEQITKAWGIDIETKNPQIMNCPLTADLSGQPLFIQLDIICAALHATYKVDGTRIWISGQGCKQAKSSSFITLKPSQSNM
ncbi:FecR family protein [Dyadobacter pollutisoli]|uniref:FecR domain-containing protein n=1 Tax=Dyadobacter pollutisoli TaxID=2910158 RepID=A0A9E8SMG5_9BACT|nr:FecR family protein [Dyadobacter pollutisoli]WAC14103.1 FecR domain-containing protein [Dyadobacter pollutisoli]